MNDKRPICDACAEYADECTCKTKPSGLVDGSALPRRPWVLSKQYRFTFVLSADNEIIVSDEHCRRIGDERLRFIIAAVNAYQPNQ